MKAIQIKEYGGPETVIVTDQVVPVPKENQVAIEIHAASINPFDVKIRSGMYKESIPLSLPYVPGGDFSGVITQLGEGVLGLNVGDEIFGSAIVLSGGTGSFAQFAVANTKTISLKPKKINFLESASLPLVGSSAIQALEEHINLKKGQKILIHGGSGGIGSIAIQLAKYIGAYVATTASSTNTAFVASLGADKIIDYKNEKFEEILSDYDAVYDTVGGATTDNSFKVLKKGGVLVSMIGKPKEELAEKYGVTVIGQNTHITTEHLARLSQLVDALVIKPIVDKVFLLEQAKEAFVYLEKGSPRGKVVLQIK
ncbi:MAG TPA: NADP-dependent oxidoreductase [Patescibacteria group bacterium]